MRLAPLHLKHLEKDKAFPGFLGASRQGWPTSRPPLVARCASFFQEFRQDLLLTVMSILGFLEVGGCRETRGFMSQKHSLWLSVRRCHS